MKHNFEVFTTLQVSFTVLVYCENFSHRGLLGDPGSSSYMFEYKGIVQITFNKETGLKMDPLELAIEVGAEDVIDEDDGTIQLTCEPHELNSVCSEIKAKEVEISSASVEYLPKSSVSLTEEQHSKAEKLLELLSGHNDVVAVYSNHELNAE